MPFSYKRQNGSPGYPPPTRQALAHRSRSFSVPHHLWGAAQVPLRYSGQPLHRKIIASRSPNTPWFCLSNRFFANFNQAIDYKSIYADSWGPENNVSNRNGGDRKSDRRRFSYSLFSVFAAWRQQSWGEVALCYLSRLWFERYYGNVATGCLKTSRGRGDRREDSRQKLSRKSFSIGDFLCGKNIFLFEKD